jgi:asparagine synthase (glutamine-hydrolysing)
MTEPAGSRPVLSIRHREGRYQASGPPVAEFRQPCDIFARWRWDGASLLAETDRYGFYPLHYCIVPDGVMLSPSLTALLAAGAPPELNYPAIATMLRAAFLPGNDTPFAAIHRLPPGGQLRWDANGVAVQGKFPAPAPRGLSRDQALHAFVAAFRDAMRRVDTGEPAVVPLSGGRDSRHILLELCHLGCPPGYCITVDPKNSNDAEVAQALAQKLGLRHIVLPHFYDARREPLKNDITNFASLEHGWMLPMIDHFEPGTSVIYDGIAGDTLSASSFLDETKLAMFRARDKAAVANLVLGDNERFLKNMLSAEMYRKLSREAAAARIEQETEAHLDTPNPVASFYFFNRARRATASAPFGVYLSIAPRIVAPYLDQEVFDLMFPLPPKFMLDRTFHTQAIALAHPQFAGVPYAEKRPAPVWRPRILFRETLRLSMAHPALFGRGWLTPRLLAGLVRGGSTMLDGIIPRVMYLAQLAELRQGRRAADPPVAASGTRR